MAAGIAAAEGMLAEHVQAPTACTWQRRGGQRLGGLAVHDLLLVTGEWRGRPWQHLLRLFVPDRIAWPGWAGLFITGGDGPPSYGCFPEDEIGAAVAQACGAPLAVLHNVPNQPLCGGLREDALIAHTFSRYVAEGDPGWPLLWPMVRSAVRALDALAACLPELGGPPADRFLVAGASKRGWTTWLTAAADPRVRAIVPMVFDTLNMPAQMARQRELWGDYSGELVDYTERGLLDPALRATTRGRELWSAVDPYTYRSGLTMPKLIVNGANDPYWATDSLRLYWDGLPGPKCAVYAPNSGHGLEERARLFCTLVAFFRLVAAGKPLPKLAARWDGPTLTVTAPAATAARAWVAASPDLDFRPRRWEPVPMKGGEGGFALSLQRPAGRNLAVFGEADFAADGITYSLATPAQILSD